MAFDDGGIRLAPVKGLPEIGAVDDLGRLIHSALLAAHQPLLEHDIVVVTHKAVAKAENRIVDLRDVEPSPFAKQYALRWEKDPRQVEVVLRESVRIVRMDRGVIIAETKHGFICANAGVDRSNVSGADQVCLLPVDPDGSAARIAETLRRLAGIAVGVIVADTFGRAWREGLTNVAIGIAGIRPIRNYIGMLDAQGRELRVTALAIADELAGAAELVMGKLDRVPVALVRGYHGEQGDGSARELIRAPELDMFR
jgi:coenzyme F420-0:L-glutamate ligase/coenzyme F420-1:gamma-L-glutamate ligase